MKPQRRAISVEDYHRMAEAGVFRADERVELLDGELIEVPPMGSPHGGGITAIYRLTDRATARARFGQSAAAGDRRCAFRART